MNKKKVIISIGILLIIAIIGLIKNGNIAFAQKGKGISVSSISTIMYSEAYRISIDFEETKVEREYSVRTKYGCLFDDVLRDDDEEMLLETTVKNGDSVYWDFMNSKEDYMLSLDELEGDPIYINIIVKENEHIVGWALVEAYQENKDVHHFEGKLIEHKEYPRIFGIYQSISQEDVEKEMEACMLD